MTDHPGAFTPVSQRCGEDGVPPGQPVGQRWSHQDVGNPEPDLARLMTAVVTTTGTVNV